MARPLRINRAGVWFHVVARGSGRKEIFGDDADRRHWLELLGEFVHRFRLHVHAYVMMSNHYHLLIETPEANLSEAMQWLQTSYSMWFNRKRGRVGPLFQGRYKAVLVEPQSWGLAISRYLHLNPVRIKALGLDKRARGADRLGLGGPPNREIVQERLKKVRAYRWSSYRVYVGREKRPEWLTCEKVLGLGRRGPEVQRRQAYERYVEEALREGLTASPWEEAIGGLVLGSREFLAKAQKGLRMGREQPQSKSLQPRPPWKQVVAAVASVRGMEWEEFKSRRGDWGRDLAWHLGRRECGLGLRELGALSGGVDYATVSAGAKRIERRLATDKGLAQKAKQVGRQLKVQFEV